MVTKISSKTVDLLVNKNFIDEDDKAIYHYGAIQLFTNLFTLGIIIVIASIVNMMVESIVYIVTFMLIRMFAGGYHANTRNKCTALTIAVYVVNIMSIAIFTDIITKPMVYIGTITCFCIIFLVGPVDHKYKPMSKEKYKGRKKIVRRISLLLTIVIIGFSMMNVQKSIVCSGVMGVFSVTVSLSIGKYVREKEKKNEEFC